MIFLRLLFILFAFATIPGCISFSTMHPAEPLRPGRAAFLLAAGYEELDIKFREEDRDTGEVREIVKGVSLPVIEYGVRYGVVRNFEVGLKSSLFGSTVVDGKYRLLKQGPFTISSGLGVGYSDVVLETNYDDKTTDSETTFSRSVYELHIPLYTSLAVTKQFYLYGTPRYLYRSSSAGGPPSLAGISVGTIFGGAMGIVLEYSTFKALGEKDSVHQFMAGLVFGFNNYYEDKFDTK